MRWPPLWITLPLTMAIFAILATTGAYFVNIRLVNRELESELARDMSVRMNMLQGAAERFIYLDAVYGMRELISGFGAEVDTLAMFMADKNGKILISTRYDEEGSHWMDLGLSIAADDIRKAADTRVMVIRTGSPGQWMDGYAAICAESDSTSLRGFGCGFLFYRADLEYRRSMASKTLWSQTLTTGGGIAAVTVVYWLIIRLLLTSRIHKVVKTLNLFTSGARWARTNMKGDEEISQIGGAVDGLLSSVERNEAALAEIGQFQRAIINSANYSIISTSLDGGILSFNANAEKSLGVKATEIVGVANITSFFNFMELALRARALTRELGLAVAPGFAALTAKAAMVGVDEQDWTIGVKNGARIHVSISVTALRGSKDQVTGFLFVAQDVTARRKAEERLLLAEKVFQAAGEAILVTDPDGRIIDVNPAYLETTGFTREEVIGANPSISKSGRHDKDFYKKMWDSIQETGAWSGEVWDRRKNGGVYPKILSISAIRDRSGQVVNYVGIFTDITSQKTTEERLARMAHYDPLTGLANRMLFRDRLEMEMESCVRHGRLGALLFLDLDKFKHVNDTMGHDHGDELLIQVARRISANIRRSDLAARLGGDEFTVILVEIDNAAMAGMVAEKIISELSRPFEILGKEAIIGVSVGIEIFPSPGHDAGQTIKNADSAMYEAKMAGRGVHRFYNPQPGQIAE